MLRIEALEIDDHILDKIESRQGAVPRGGGGLLLAASSRPSRTAGRVQGLQPPEAGRYLLVVLVDLGSGVWNVATARDMTDRERRLYRRERGD